MIKLLHRIDLESLKKTGVFHLIRISRKIDYITEYLIDYEVIPTDGTIGCIDADSMNNKNAVAKSVAASLRRGYENSSFGVFKHTTRAETAMVIKVFELVIKG